MLSVCFEDKIINFTPDLPYGTRDVKLLHECDFDIAKVLKKLEKSNSLWVVSPRFGELFERFKQLFTLSQAAGGIVRNARGELLMIFKEGHWDLPKGHREPGEGWAECALRETVEECGIDAPQCGPEVGVTWHTYRLDGRWMLKECHWFAMESLSGRQPEPQTDEGISRAEWVGVNELEERLAQSYLTIRNLITRK